MAIETGFPSVPTIYESEGGGLRLGACFCNVLICHSALAFRYYTLLFCHCILVFFNFDMGKSCFAVVICHFHSMHFIMVFCQGNMKFGMTLRNEFWTR